jgi:hypothetical protein
MAALFLAATGYALWPRSPQRRNRSVERWARYNVATLTPQLFTAIDRALTRRLRSAAIWMLIAAATVAVIAVAYPQASLTEAWIVLVAFGIATTLSFAFQLTWPWLEAGQTRVARAQPVRLSDYLPTSVRISAWASGVICLITTLMLPVLMSPSPRMVAQMLLLGGIVISLIVAEWTGQRVTRRPQPAASDAELYAQDAWRADIAQLGYRSIALWAGIALTQVSVGHSLHPQISNAITFVAIALLATSVLTLAFSIKPADRFRARLWPRLHPGEFVGQHAGVSA